MMVLVQRDGDAYVKPIDHADAETLKGAILETVAEDSTILTDEWSAYEGIGSEFAGGHHSVTRSLKESVRRTENGDMIVLTNTAESYFGLLKRGHMGVFHQLSKKHFARYLNEFSFRWRYRKVSYGERMVSAIKGMEGKRLTYREPE